MAILFSPPLTCRSCRSFRVVLLVVISSFCVTYADNSNGNNITCSPGSGPDGTVWLVLDECEIAGIPGAATVHSWGAKIGITNDATANQFCVSPSTVVNNTFLLDDGICQTLRLNGTTADQCRSRRGNFVDRGASRLTTVDVGILARDDGWQSFQDPLPAFQSAANVALRWPKPDFTMNLGLVSESVNSNQAQLGLAMNSTFINALKSSGIINSRSWALNSGSINRGPGGSDSRQGSLVFGGYDQESRMKSDGWIEIPMDYDEMLGDRHCPLQVKVNQIDVQFETGDGTPNRVTLSERSRSMTACLEPQDYLPRFPGTLLRQFLDAVKNATTIEPVASDTLFGSDSGGSNSGNGPKKSDFLVLEPGLSFKTAQFPDFNMSLFITLENGRVIEIPDHEMKHPLSGLARDGSVVVDHNHTEILVFSQVNVGNAFSFGRSFLSQLYLFVDLDNKMMRLDDQNRQARVPTPVPWVCSSVMSNTDQEWPLGKKIGVGLGAGLGGLGIFGLGIWYFFFYKPKKRRRDIARDAANVSHELPNLD